LKDHLSFLRLALVVQSSVELDIARPRGLSLKAATGPTAVLLFWFVSPRPLLQRTVRAVGANRQSCSDRHECDASPPPSRQKPLGARNFA